MACNEKERSNTYKYTYLKMIEISYRFLTYEKLYFSIVKTNGENAITINQIRQPMEF